MSNITPSKTSPWHGTPVEGSAYTRQQLDVLAIERPRQISFHDRPVKLSSPTRYRWEVPETRTVLCPIIARTKDNSKVLVIAPAGDKMWLPAVPQK